MTSYKLTGLKMRAIYSTMIRIMALDYGTKKIGVAFSDPTGGFVSETVTIRSKSEKEALQKISDMAEELNVGRILLGYPLLEDGSAGEMARTVQKFKLKLEKQLDQQIVLVDERFTSEEAEEYLHAQGKKIKGNRDKLDAISAAILLTDYLRETGRL